MPEHEPGAPRVRDVVHFHVLVLLLSGDAVFLLLHLSNGWLGPPNVLFALDTDGGYAELFQYLKEYWIAIVLFAACWRTREGVYAAWALLFTYFLFDDALDLHATAGRAVARSFHLGGGLGLRARDLGEITVSAVVGGAFLIAIVLLYLRSSERARGVSRDLVLMVAALAFFGVAVDMAHTLVTRGWQLWSVGRVALVVEEVGEMAAMSVITGYAVRLFEGPGHLAGLVWRWVVRAPGRRPAAPPV